MHHFKAEVATGDSNVYGHYIIVPKDVSDQYLDTDKRMICTINGSLKVQCALIPIGNSEYIVLLNKELRKKFKLNLGDSLEVELEKDDSEYGMPVPEELIELWEIDIEAYDVFQSMTKGKQRSLIHQIGIGKRSETRAKKAVAIMEYLKTVGGKLDYKEMNQFIKNYNTL